MDKLFCNTENRPPCYGQGQYIIKPGFFAYLSKFFIHNNFYIQLNIV